MFYRLLNIPGANKRNVPAASGLSELISKANYVSPWYQTETEIFGSSIRVAIPGNFSQLAYTSPQLHSNILILSINNPGNDDDAVMGGTAYEVTSARLGNSQIWIEAEIWGVLTYQLSCFANVSTDSIELSRRLPLPTDRVPYENLPAQPPAIWLGTTHTSTSNIERKVLVTMSCTIQGAGTEDNPYVVSNYVDNTSYGGPTVWLFGLFGDTEEETAYPKIIKALNIVANKLGTALTDKIVRIQLIPQNIIVTTQGNPYNFRVGKDVIRESQVVSIGRSQLYEFIPDSSPLYPSAARASSTIRLTSFGVDLATVDADDHLLFNYIGSLVNGVNLFCEIVKPDAQTLYIGVPTWEVLTVASGYTQWVKENAQAFTNQLTSSAISIIGSSLVAIAGIAAGGIGIPAAIAAGANIVGQVANINKQKDAYKTNSQNAKLLQSTAGQVSGYTGMYSQLNQLTFHIFGLDTQSTAKLMQIVARNGVPDYGTTSLRNTKRFTNYDYISGFAEVNWVISPYSPTFCSIKECTEAFQAEVSSGFNIWYLNPIGKYDVNPVYEPI